MRTILFMLIVFFVNLSIFAQKFWPPQTSPTSKRLWSLKAVDSKVVWACGDSGTVVRTTDGGVNWSLTSAPNNSLNCYSIEAINADTAWVVSTNNLGGNTALYKTTDGGISWQIKQSSNLPASYYNAVKFYDKDNGLFYGDPENGYFTIFTTDNGGDTWIRVDSTKIPAPDGSDEYGVTDNLAISGNKAWFGTQRDFGENARLFYSNDKGKSWAVIAIVDYSYINTIAFSTELIGIIVCDNNEVGYTRDGGFTWKIQWVPLIGAGSSFATSSSFVLVGGSWSNISTDGGVTWEENESNATSLEAVSFANPSEGWAVGYNGEILKWNGDAFPDLPVSVKDEFKNNVPYEFNLNQNYPNPFNPRTTIEYSIPKQSHVSIKVYDLLGREVITLVDEEKPVGNYSVKFEGSILQSGVYFYQLKSGSYSQTRKLLLLK